MLQKRISTQRRFKMAAQWQDLTAVGVISHLILKKQKNKKINDLRLC